MIFFLTPMFCTRHLDSEPQFLCLLKDLFCSLFGGFFGGINLPVSIKYFEIFQAIFCLFFVSKEIDLDFDSHHLKVLFFFFSFSKSLRKACHRKEVL